MAFENGRYECDRCGKKIKEGQCLCKKCNEWLETYLKARKCFEQKEAKGE